MATVSTHLLNSIDGTHAGNVSVALFRIAVDGRRVTLFETQTDSGGRFSEKVADDEVDPSANYELCFKVGKFWRATRPEDNPGRIIDEIVLRFTMPDQSGTYHSPVIMSPNGYSTWMSA